MNLSPADAEVLLIRLISERAYNGYDSSSYEISISGLVRGHISLTNLRPGQPPDTEVNDLLQVLWPVAWDFARRGILRPGVQQYPNFTNSDALGDGYAITPFGKQWFAAANKNEFLPTEPGRFAQILGPYRDRFGVTFHDRAQEAMRCYAAQANLACCVMCGSASETILLVACETKIGVTEVQHIYRGANGKKKVEDALFGQSKLRDQALPYLNLIHYWRTDGAHGKASKIGENEAYTSLALLLRFATFVTDNWDELTVKAEIS
jgi:hypothetical protein